MTLNKNYKYWVLCEDKQSQCFIRYFLMGQGIKNHHIICMPLPADTIGGSGSKYVIDNYPIELKRLRMQNYNSAALLIGLDADARTVHECRLELDRSCKEAGVETRRKEETVCFFISKRNVETWIYYYRGERAVNEQDDYGHFRKEESKCRDASEKMSAHFIEGIKEDDESVLPSLRAAYKEYRELCYSEKPT